MSLPSSIVDRIFHLLQDAERLEEVETRRVEAANKYLGAVYLIEELLLAQSSGVDLPSRELFVHKAQHYRKVASRLFALSGEASSGSIERVASPITESIAIAIPVSPEVPHSIIDLSRGSMSNAPQAAQSRADDCLRQAIEMEEGATTRTAAIVEAARQLYRQAAQHYMEAWQAAASNNSGTDVAMLERRATQAIGRAEQLEAEHAALERAAAVPATVVAGTNRARQVAVVVMPPPASPAVIPAVEPPANGSGQCDRAAGPHGRPDHNRTLSSATHEQERLSQQEVEILRQSSLITSGLFMPWNDADGVAVAQEAAATNPAHLFRDPAGDIQRLSSKQRDHFDRWARPSEICELRLQQGRTGRLQTPVMLSGLWPSPHTIRQEFVTDCSLIAGLCAGAELEQRFQRRVVSSILYPQTRDGLLLMNPRGRYLVKLWLNGVARCVEIDDRLPIDRYGRLLCSTTSGFDSLVLELWVPLIEKAYMKLCGGYDFPGSNSGVDLFSLTGWIPERFYFPEDHNAPRPHETLPERGWARIQQASGHGDTLMTVSSSPSLDRAEADQLGLVTDHAYAVLRVLETRNGTRLLLLKNPWAHTSWRGRYSSHDRASWQDAAFCREVGYDATAAARQDDGVFRICWADIVQYFSNFQMSWNPALFRHRVTTHDNWPANQGPRNDTYNVSDNPQYVLRMSQPALQRVRDGRPVSVWIMISRHVHHQEQTGERPRDFLSLHVHRGNAEHERSWYAGQSGGCVLPGVYTDNPHALTCYDLQDAERDKYLNLVLSQIEKSHDVAYTLSVYCPFEFSLDRPRSHLPFKYANTTHFGADGHAEDGSRRLALFVSPGCRMYAVSVPSALELQLVLKTHGEVAPYALLMPVARFGDRFDAARPGQTSGLDTSRTQHRHGFVAAPRTAIAGGNYVLVLDSRPRTSSVPVVLEVYSSKALRIEPIPGG